MTTTENFLWAERTRPTRVEDLILPENLKRTLSEFVSQGSLPNLLLVGGAGVGKTSAAIAMFKELDCDFITINGSLNGDIDTLRNEIQNFASTMSFAGGRKMVLLDEADYLSGKVQASLRNFMETYSSNCGFVLTANFPNKIIDPLHSRCSTIDFKITKNDKPELMGQLYKRVKTFLDAEGIEYQKEAIQTLISKQYPDCRRIWNDLQRYSATGKIDTGILLDLSEESFKSLISHLKKKEFTAVRKWVAEHSDRDPTYIFRKLYDASSSLMKPDSIPQLVLHLAKYQFQATSVADSEINLVACLVEIMVDVEWL